MNPGGTPSVVFLNRYYWPQTPATGQMLTDLAEDLAIRGWDVTVITSRTPFAGAACDLRRRETHNRVKIIRVTASRLPRKRTAGRVLSYLQYFFGAATALLRLPRPDVVVAMTDPPLLVLPALVLARLRRSRAVYWVQDHFPHRAARLGVVVRGRLAHRGLETLATFAHLGCDAIVGPGERITDAILSTGAPPDRVYCIHNWEDTVGIHPIRPEFNPFRAEHGLEGAFVVLYSGRVRGSHSFSAVMEAARLLRNVEDVVFLFIGDGDRLPHLSAQAWKLGLENVRFMPPLPRPELAYSLSGADVALVTEEPDLANLRIPSKTYRILASGRPLLFAGSEQSDVARIVTRHECGFVVGPNDGEALAATILRMRDNPGEAAAMGARAREAAVNLYDRRIATHHWQDLLHYLVKPATAQPAARDTGTRRPMVQVLAGAEFRPIPWSSTGPDRLPDQWHRDDGAQKPEPGAQPNVAARHWDVQRRGQRGEQYRWEESTTHKAHPNGSETQLRGRDPQGNAERRRADDGSDHEAPGHQDPEPANGGTTDPPAGEQTPGQLAADGVRAVS
jgi:colanic acid biosynthesis glycosyl transferase WcaI